MVPPERGLLHPPAGPADEPVPRRGAREEGRLPSPPPPDSPSDDKPSPSPSDGGIGNSSVAAAVWLRMLAGMPPPKMLMTSTCSCRSRCSCSSARPTRSFRCGPRLSKLHWLRRAPALASCSSSTIMHYGGSRLKNETPPITKLSQERSSMQRPALATPCPLALRSAAAWTRTGIGTRARTRPARRACPEHCTPPLPRQTQLRRVDRRNHRGPSKLNVWAAHMRIALSYSEPKYVVWRCGRTDCCACGCGSTQFAARALAQVY